MSDCGRSPTTAGSTVRLLQIEEFNTDLLLGGCFKAFGENPGKTQRYFRMLCQKVSEVGSSESEHDGRLDSGDGCRPGLACQQRHFAHRSAFAKLCDKEIDPRAGIFLAHFGAGPT